MQAVKHIIVGQGLAGTALAWQLLWRGRRILVVDRGNAVTASKIAAGLITPITGKRLAVDERFDEYFAAARAFYRRVEAETGKTFFHQPGSVRILRDREECERFDRKHDGELRNRTSMAALDAAHFDAPLGCFAIPDAGRLDVPTYLAASRRFFESRDSFRPASYEELDVAAESVIFCTGIAAFRERQLPAEWFQPAKGEILTLRIPGLAEDRIINRGVWLMRVGGDLYRAGATYAWDILDDVPTAVGREELESRVKAFLKYPFEVVGHEAATRPITPDRQPLLKQLLPRVWAFNGLGSKGALLAPHYSERLATLLLSGGRQPPVEEENKLARGVDAPGSGKRLTEQAHDLVREVLRPGDIAIDATAGNGHDTLFLAKVVGATGQVFAFDLQAAAIEVTAMRLHEAGLANVTLLQRDHREMARHIPANYHGQIAAITFNLGYLPGGDKTIVTNPETTARAISEAMRLLSPRGILTIITYVAHAGGMKEDESVRLALSEQPFQMIVGEGEMSPRLYVVSSNPLGSALSG